MGRDYDIGDAISLTGTFADIDGTPTSPTTVTCKVRQPDGTIEDLVATPGATGVYTATFTASQAGEHWARFAGTGALQAAEEIAFIVETQHVT